MSANKLGSVKLFLIYPLLFAANSINIIFQIQISSKNSVYRLGTLHSFSGSRSNLSLKYVTQHELMRLFDGDIKTDILNSTYCSISKKHFDTKTIIISYFYQKL